MREARRPLLTGGAVLLVAALTGCAPAATPAPTAAARPATRSARPPAPAADCTRATKVALTGTGFRPGALTIQRGAFLAVTNKSSASHRLEAPPDAGMVTSVVARKERQVIQFPEAGTFTVRAGDAALRLTVAGESGCGAPEPTLTIGRGGAFRPGATEVTATENFAVVNDSGVAQSVICTPGGGNDHTRLDAGETQILALDEPGRYVCASPQHPATKVTVTVAAP